MCSQAVMIDDSRMAKPPAQIDVLVLGDHPSAYLAAAVLQRDGGLQVAHARIPGEALTDRLVLVNPELFELDPIFRSMKRRLHLSPTYGLRFLGEQADQTNGSVRKTIGAYVASLKEIHSGLSRAAKAEGVVSLPQKQVEIRGADETGLDFAFNGSPMRARLLLLAGELPLEQRRMLGLPAWLPEAISRYSFIQIKGTCDLGKHPMIPMCLNLRDTHHWAWLMPWRGYLQLAVEQPAESVGQVTPESLIAEWAKVLGVHGILKYDAARIAHIKPVSLDLPLAGALTGEGVANRTLCIGPAGGFFTACAEDIYPNCWSALCAAEVARSALKERHLQDALQAYRQKWGATLGDYLRGPQQNLRFLLPLVYRNPTMASRLVDAILLGKSVVR